MERDNKFSGTLPLLAYAPQDFGLNIQRSRAYRARAAMGRTGVQPLRSHAQAPAQAPAQTSVKAERAVLAEPAPVSSSSLFKKLWLNLSSLLKRGKQAETAAEQPAQPVVTRQMPVAPVAKQMPVKQADAEPQELKQQPAEEVIAEVRQPVSKTYAAMRKNALGNAAADQTIPEAADLSHALAEIRQALREHEKLASARQNENSSR
ncbi:hypothetical protein KHQ08_04920 [Pseudochrobactrum algeriensis]|uniref:hypothetical protein n=1 Tax=Pseudochrobactrum algeriensis TaxID=2834768 RepID=UPI001BCC9D10|nr:hypothetical protein [Pseudochrobactrum algeriensis]MBX8812047.1 hypothetical protein [Ochrobactrum sp. MR34]QVQ37406.1 hypothetical protein KHQ08_04920 [Pseudochrobactrum algeriensis]QVQ40625.1 hypothetical protein KHQ07_03215 [Pseudochrobactrum algeriensis]QVQ44547.1 hypothetical protein KHQ09_05185 [Pseudochrobactrum algeriensis]